MTAISRYAHHLSRAGLFGIALATAAVIFAVAFVARLLIGPISLGPFTGDLRASLNRTLPGLAVRFDDAALEWSRDEGRLNLVVLGAKVLDEHQRIIAQAPEAEIGLAVWPLIQGHVVVHRIALVGVQLTLVHSRDGVLRLGVEGEHEQSDVLQRIRDAIARSGSGPSSLDSFAVDRARLAFYEEETGAFVVAPKATLQITRENRRDPERGGIKATVDALIEISGKPAHVEAVLNLPAAGGNMTGDVSVKGLSLRSLASNSHFFAFLAPFDMTADVSGSFALVNGTQVRSAEFGIGAAGMVEGLGKPLRVKSFRIAGRYDGQAGRLLIDDATLQGVQAHAHVTGTGDLDFDPAGRLTRAGLDLQMDKLAVNLPGVMGRPVAIARAAVRGEYLPQTGVVNIEQAFVYGDQLSAKFTGRVVPAGDKSPGIDLDGSVAPMGVKDLLRYWPLQASPGARDWIEENIPVGHVGPIVLHTHMLPGALDQAALAEDALNLTFPVSGATVTYIRGLTPATGVAGNCILTGDTFKADVSSGMIGPLAVSDAHGLIPKLHIAGTVGIISAHIDGAVGDLLALTDQKPLQYPSRFHIRSASAKGSAGVDMQVKVPMLRNLRVDDVGILVRAQTHDLGLAVNDHLTLSNGAVNFVVDNASLRAVGNVSLGSAALGIDWTETFRPKGPYSTLVRISGTLPEDAREALGIHGDGYLTGPVQVSGELDGVRGNIRHGQLKLDLTPAALSVGIMGYEKAAGTAAQAQLALRLDSDGSVRTADVVVTGTALAAKGSIRFSPTGDLQTLDVPYFRAGAFDDFSLSLVHDPVQGSTVTSWGRSFDAQAMLREDEKAVVETPGKAEPPPTPYHINSRVDRIVLREGVVVTPFSLNISGVGKQVRTLSLAATQSKTAQIIGTMVAGEDGTHLKLSAGDAGLLLKGLFGSTSLHGGTIDVDAAMPAANAKGDAADYSGRFSISDFNVVNQPFLTRLFAAGSFGGLADLMRGKGIGIDKLDVPFALHGSVINVRDARATGPSLGLTGDGYYDTRTSQLALQGVFTPLFGINSVLGQIPVIGNVFGSKKGEGLIGVTYSASGSADNPNVSVNPFSMVTPGILRRIFQGNIPSAPVQATTNPPVPIPKPQ